MRQWLGRVFAVALLLWVGTSQAEQADDELYYMCADGSLTQSDFFCNSRGGYVCLSSVSSRRLAPRPADCEPRPLQVRKSGLIFRCTNSRGEWFAGSAQSGCGGTGTMFSCGDGTRQPRLADCATHGGPQLISAHGSPSICGDELLNPGEQCDNGPANSDTSPDACRTNCRFPRCGDGVTDTGEECDEREWRLAGTPNHCRADCTLPVCGDGIHDDQYGEQCDDGNRDDTDGCRRDCRICLRVDDNLEDITSDALLCRDRYSVVDYGDEGALIIKRPNVVLDCNGATISGDGRGTGIVVLRADGAVIRNCTVTGFDTGIKVVGSRGVVIRDGQNPVYGNRQGVVKDNSEVRAENLSRPQIKVPARSGSRAVAGGAGAAIKEQAPSRAPGSIAGGASATQAARAGSARPDAASDGWVPTIRYPRANQRFNAPATLRVRLQVKPREPVTYLLRTLPARHVEARSRSGEFRNIAAGRYCVEAALASNPSARSECVPFEVTVPASQPATHPGGESKPQPLPRPIQPVPRLPVPKSGG